MDRKISIIFLFFIVTSCGVVKKKTSYGKERKITVEASEEAPADSIDKAIDEPLPVLDVKTDKAEEIINTAMSFSGVRYKYGGTTSKGMDCSGLLYVSFKEHKINIPRVSHQLANEGKRIRVEDINKGDLLFFKTSSRGKRINHVGLVVAVEDDDVKFIHATSSRGVIVSSLREGFWNFAFVKATRIL